MVGEEVFQSERRVGTEARVTVSCFLGGCVQGATDHESGEGRSRSRGIPEVTLYLVRCNGESRKKLKQGSDVLVVRK